MKQSSFTCVSTHNSCPKRYYFRYLASKEEQSRNLLPHLALVKKLMGHRELIGHIAHEWMANLIRKIAADGINARETVSLEEGAIEQYRQIITHSKRAGRGCFVQEGIQVAEHFNGIGSEVSEEDTVIELKHLFEKGQQHLALLGICQGDLIEVEVEDCFKTNRGLYRVKVDLVLRRNGKVIIVDWKTRNHLGGQDRHQVQSYLEWARRRRNIPPTDLIGMLASLRSGEIAKVHYDPFADLSFSEGPPPPHQETKKPTIPKSLEITPKDRYPATPNRGTCGACPFATVCPDALNGGVL